MPPIPVRAAGAELARRLTSALAARAERGAGGAGAVGSSGSLESEGATGPLVVVVVGPAGSGRSGVLDSAAAVVQRVGAGVRRVDDVHRFDDERLRALVEQPGAEVLLLSWVDPHPPRDGLGELARLAGRDRLLIELGPLDEDELANGVATVFGAPPDRVLTDWLVANTCGQPWLVAATLDALDAARLVVRGRFSGHPPTQEDAALAPVHERVRAELRALPASTRPVLAAIVAAPEPDTLNEIAIAGADAWQTLNAAGLANRTGVAPSVLAAAGELLSPAELAGGHQAVARLLGRRGVSPVVRAEHAWAGRSHGDDAATSFFDAGLALLGGQPAVAGEWFDRAAASASVGSPLAAAAKGAQAESLVLAGSLPAAVELADFVLARAPGEPHATNAVALAAAAGGRWVDAARWSGRVRGHRGVSDDWWVWQELAALLLAGRIADADRRYAELDANEPVGPVVSQLRDAVEALRESLRPDAAMLHHARENARSLVGSQALAAPPLVGSLGPVELLAVVALALGEPEGARQAFVAASHVPLDERRKALARWTVLRCGDLVRPSEAAGGDAAPELVSLAVDAALARRNGDVAAAGVVSRALPRLLSSLQLDLLNLDASTELLLVARRFGPPSAAEELESAIESFLAGIGWAPAWTARWHWARLEAAISAGAAVEGLAQPAAALAAIAAVLPGMSVLADAAEVWVEVLGGRPDPDRIDGAVKSLRTSGHVWEAAQLAGQAAIRVEDANLAKSLLGQARALRGGGGGAGAGSGPAEPARATGRDGGAREDSGAVTPAGLSEREVEVARLVLNGLTHKAIGATLYISPKTVEHHVAHIRQKLGATNRAEFLAALRVDLAAHADV